MLSVNCPFRDALANVFKGDSVACTLSNNTTYDIYDEGIDRYYLFYDFNFKSRLRSIPKGSKCSIFVRMSVKVGGAEDAIGVKQWQGIAKLSADMYPHCVLPYATEEDIKQYFGVKSPNVSLREKQLRLIERMSWYEELIDRSICERVLDAFGSVANILESDKSTMTKVLGDECESVVDVMQQFIQAKQDYYIQ